jgi:hypothetical protein
MEQSIRRFLPAEFIERQKGYEVRPPPGASVHFFHAITGVLSYIIADLANCNPSLFHTLYIVPVPLLILDGRSHES